MKKMFNKKIFIVLGIIFIIMILAFIFKDNIKETIYQNKLNSINRDIVIVREVAVGLMSDGGSSPTSITYFVDLNSATIYDNSLKKSKKLDNEEIEELKKLADSESETIDNSPFRMFYYTIVCNGKQVTLNNLSDSVYDIINELDNN